MTILSVFAWILSNSAENLSFSGDILSDPSNILSVSPFIPANPLFRGHPADHSFCFRLDSFCFNRYSFQSEHYSFRFPIIHAKLHIQICRAYKKIPAWPASASAGI
ncbi:hypothetical protein [Bacillus ectoiniformans]|uniref:hypothetical protein n=1 Tax=Bacillus ectoiniformans TaxID=1494429 RepID=UPI0019599F67|nr:hypothetical protein [Bacillus ectoiniformans]